MCLRRRRSLACLVLIGVQVALSSGGVSDTSVTNLRFVDTDTAKFRISGIVEWDPPIQDDEVTAYEVFIAFDERNSEGTNLWYNGDGGYDKVLPVGTNQFPVLPNTVRQTKQLQNPDYPANWLLVLSRSHSGWQSADEAAKMLLYDESLEPPDMLDLSIDTSSVRATESGLVGTIQWTLDSSADLGFTRSYVLYLDYNPGGLFPLNEIGQVPVGTNEFVLDITDSCESVRYVRLFVSNDNGRSESGRSEALQVCFVETSTSGTTTSTFTVTNTATPTTTTTTSASLTATTTTSTSTGTATGSTTTTATETGTTTATQTATSTTATATSTLTASTYTSTATATATTTATATGTTASSTTTLTTTSTTATILLDGPGWLAAVQQSEDAVAAKLASLASGDKDAEITEQTPEATIVAHWIEATALQPGVGSFDVVEVPSSGVVVTVPHSVLAAVGGNVILSVAAFRPGSIDSFERPAVDATLGSVPVSIRVRSAEGTLGDATFASGLPELITVQLTSAPLDGAHCAYLDEAEQRWKSQGVHPAVSEGGGFTCTAAHLTVFAAILGDFERVFLCSNVLVFSGEGLKAIGHGQWSRRAPAVFLWLFLASQLFMLAWAVYSDCKAYRTALWRDADFLTDNKAFEGRSDSCMAYLCEYFGRYLPGRGAVERQGRIAALVESICVTIAADAAHYEVARQANIVAIDMKDLILCTATPQGARTPLSPAGNLNSPTMMARIVSGAVSRTVRGLEAKVRRKVPSIMNRFLASGFCSLAWSTFGALHPWAQLGQYSTTFGASIRSLLLTAKLLGALTISALFFDASGNATSLGSSPNCEVFHTGTILARGVVVGTCSVLLSVVPVLLISCCSNRRFIFRDCWEDVEIRGYVLCWRTQDIVMISLAAVYSVLCQLCVMAFLANLNPNSEAEYLVSVVFVLAREFVLMPWALAVIYASVATVIIRTHPQLSEQVKERLDMELGLTASLSGTDGATCRGEPGDGGGSCSEELDEPISLELSAARRRRHDVHKVVSDSEAGEDGVTSDVGAVNTGQAGLPGLAAALEAMREEEAGPAAPSSCVKAPEPTSTPLEPTGTAASMNLTGASMDLPGVPVDSEVVREANVREGEC